MSEPMTATDDALLWEIVGRMNRAVELAGYYGNHPKIIDAVSKEAVAIIREKVAEERERAERWVKHNLDDDAIRSFREHMLSASLKEPAHE